MRRIKHFLLILLLSINVFSMASSAPIENLSNVKKQLMAYHDSGRYYQDMATVVKEARDYLQFRLIQNKRAKNPQKLAIVFDIDETSLSNYPNMVKLDFGGTLKEINELENQGHDQALPSTLSLYQFARANAVAVFFITGRKEYERASTTENLKHVGYHDWVTLYLKPNDYKESSVVPYKSAMRHKIETQGYDIAVNLGDQESDLKGGFSDMVFKLPNPYYLIN